MKKKIGIGVFGAWRGSAYISNLRFIDGAYVHSVCDINEKALESVKHLCPEDTRFFTDVNEFFDYGMDAIILCNYFHEHASFAIKAMERGIHVLSETSAAATLKECVLLCETVEKTKMTYALAENYPYMLSNMELRRIYKEGTLGEVLYGEGEYVHPFSVEDMKHLIPHPGHWRAWIPRTYYLTHSLAPLMYMTDTVPKAVNTKSIYSKYLEKMSEEAKIKQPTDIASIMLVEMDNGAIFRITGWASFGPHGNWYRLACEKGGAENVRGNQDLVRIAYNHWSKPEGEEFDRTYKPEWPSNKELAQKAGHGGGDFWVLHNFVEDITEGKDPYFNVYRACSMAAVGIIGWRSSLDRGKEYPIPDFTNKEDRDKYRDDDLSPYPDKDGKVSLPYDSRQKEES